MGRNSTSSGSLLSDTEQRKLLVVKHAIFYILWAAVFGIEFLYRSALFNRSIELQIELQPHITSGGKVIFQGLSMWGDGAPYFVAFAVIFNWDTRARAFYYILFLTVVGFLMNITKMAYHEPRPFMVTDQITVYGCSAEYGNPSGHSLFAAGFNFFFFLDICHGGKYKYSAPLYALLLFIATSLTFLIGFARFYVGVHTLNQIVYGWQLGLLLAFYFHYCLRDPVMKHIEQIIEKKTSHISYGKLLLISSVLMALSFGGQIVTFVISQMILDQSNIEQSFLAKQADCAKYAGSNWLFNRKSVIISGLGCMAYGAYLGILFQARYYRSLDWSSMLKTPIVKFLLRILVMAVLAGPFGAIFFAVPTDADLTVSIIFKTFVPLILALFSMFAFSNFFFVRFKLVNESHAALLPIDERIKQYKFESEPQKHH